jgi:hypothetical protein
VRVQRVANRIVETRGSFLVFLVFFEIRSYCVAQAGLELLSSRDSPISASEVAEWHHAQIFWLLKNGLDVLGTSLQTEK